MQLAAEMRQCAAQLRRLFASPQPHGFNGARFESTSGWSRRKAGRPHLLIIIYVPLLSLQMQEGCSKAVASKAQAAIPTLLSIRNGTIRLSPQRSGAHLQRGLLQNQQQEVTQCPSPVPCLHHPFCLGRSSHSSRSPNTSQPTELRQSCSCRCSQNPSTMLCPPTASCEMPEKAALVHTSLHTLHLSTF